MRLQGITIPDSKNLGIGLTALYGVGRAQAKVILDQVGVAYDKKPGELGELQENKIREVLSAMKIEGELKREISANVKRLKDLQSYRGMRHSRRMPARGQRTRTNSRTIRGNVRRTMGSGKKKVEKK